jgi:hypothetical protein
MSSSFPSGSAAGLRRHAVRLPAVLALVAAGALLAGACASAGGKQVSPEEAAAREAPVTLLVKNYNWNTVHVYVVGAGVSVSMGQLTSMGTATYEIPRSVLASDRSIRLIADPIGSRRAYISEPVLVSPGDQVEWTINNLLVHSVISVH